MGLKSLPQHFIQPPEARLNATHFLSEDSIPIIDASKWDDPNIGKSICEAAENWGFFQIINHGIALEILECVKEAGHRFFELPVEERRKWIKENSPTHSVQLMTSLSPLAVKVLEWKDYLFHIYDSKDESSQLWPSVSKDQVLDYMKWVQPVIRKLLDVLLKGLNVKEIDEAKKSALMGTLMVNLVYYPKCPNPELTAGAGPHADISSITVLLQDEVGGFHMRAPQGNGWIHVPPTKGALVINIGDILQIMSNDRYKSVEHRVFVNSERNRISVPVFVNPSPDAVIGPLPQVLEGGEKPLYKQVVYSDYFSYFFSKGHEGKYTIEYAKI